MLFTSYEFVLMFLPVVLATVLGASALGLRPVAKALLLLASLVFYAWWNPPYLLFLLTVITFNFAVGSWLIMTRGQSSLERPRKLVMLGGVAANIATIIYFKYSAFLVDAFGSLVGHRFEYASVVMPLGISFIVFQKIAFLVDAYSGQIEKLGVLDYGLFVSFFPQLISGPIVHHREVFPQFESESSIRYVPTVVPVAISFFVLGAFKKVVIADAFSSHVAAVFAGASAGTQLGFFAAWGGAVSYTLQVYFDFSGYSDIAIGLGLLFGIRLPFNFNSPLKASSPIDYWGRWHKTLTRFLTAYVYNPMALAATRRRIARRRSIKVDGIMTVGAFFRLLAVPTLVTMFLAGAWHGAGYQFVVFGLVHGMYLVANHAWRNLRRGNDNGASSTFKTVISRASTLLLVILAIPFFRADSVASGWAVVRGMLGVDGLSMQAALFERSFVLLLVFVFVMAQVLPNTQELMREGLERATAPLAKHPGDAKDDAVSRAWAWPNLTWRPSIAWALAFGALAWFVLLRIAKPTEFLYFQF